MLSSHELLIEFKMTAKASPVLTGTHMWLEWIHTDFEGLPLLLIFYNFPILKRSGWRSHRLISRSGFWYHEEGYLVQGGILAQQSCQILKNSDLRASHFQKTYNLIQRKILSFFLLILADFLPCCVFLPQPLGGTHLWSWVCSKSGVGEGLGHLLPEPRRKPSFITYSTLK